MQVLLDGSRMTDRRSVHDCLQRGLELPAYYGRNLDALYDLLTECREETEILVTHWETMEVALGQYAAALMDTLYDAAVENPKLRIQVK